MKPRPFPLIALIAIIFAFIAGCAGVQFNWGSTAENLAKAAGILVVGNNPDYKDVMITYANGLLAENDPVDFNTGLKKGVNKLLASYVENEEARAAIVACLPDIQLEEGAIPTSAWMDKVKPVVRAFIAGVKIGAPQEVGSLSVTGLDEIPSGEVADDTLDLNLDDTLTYDSKDRWEAAGLGDLWDREIEFLIGRTLAVGGL